MKEIVLQSLNVPKTIDELKDNAVIGIQHPSGSRAFFARNVSESVFSAVFFKTRKVVELSRDPLLNSMECLKTLLQENFKVFEFENAKELAAWLVE